MTPRTAVRLTLTSLLASAGWVALAPGAHACSVEPLIASVCAMAVQGAQYSGISGIYVLAAGQTLPISSNSALFALLGTTYGGNGPQNFQLPDLRGRVIVGYNPAALGKIPAFQTGDKGGSTSIVLLQSQLPAAPLPITNLPVALGTLTATTSLSGLSATANLAGITLSGAASGLHIAASSNGTGLGTPSGNYLGKAAANAGALYTNSAPDVSLNAGSIQGTLTLAVASGVTAPVSISGNATTTLAGSGVGNGSTAVMGAGAAIPVLPPYLALPYYIAVNGVFPSRP